MSLIWQDHTKQRELVQRQPMTRRRMNWWMVAAGAGSIVLWLGLIAAGRIVYELVLR